MISRPFSGPRRLVLIQSGKFDFAEIDLSRPLQLVGVNGLGKTALISTLQYLYLDDQRAMRFGTHGPEETRRFYFRGEESFILFECETSLGTVTLGARSLGPAAGYELQRFVWHGPFDRADFITAEGRPRTWDEIRPALAARGLRLIQEAAELRGLLGAIDAETENSWGLVPLIEARDYPRFRQTFQRLLQLRELRQDDLKQLLADCAKLGPSEREIDLARDFDRDLATIDRDRGEVAALRHAVPLVAEVRRLYDDELSARRLAHQLVRELHERYARHTANFRQNIDEIYRVRDAAFKEGQRLEGERENFEVQRTAVDQQAGAVQQKLTELAQAKERFATFVPEIEEQVRQNLGNEVAALKARLADVPAESMEVLQRQLEEKRDQRKSREDTARRLAELFVTWLRERLPEESVARLGALFDRNLLEAVMDERVSIHDEKELLRRLRAWAGQCDARGYEDETLQVEFAPSALNSAGNIGRVERVEEEARDLRRQVERLGRQIETLRDARPWKEKLTAAERAYDAQVRRLADFEDFQEALAKEDALNGQLAELQKASREWTKRLAENEAVRAEQKRLGEAAVAQAQQLIDDDKLIREEAKNMPVAEGDDPGAISPADAAVAFPASLLEGFKLTRDRCNKARALAQQLRDKIAVLDQQFMTASFRYDASAVVVEKLVLLEAEILSLDERTQGIENRWRAVLVSARRGFDTILRSLKALQKKRRELNEELKAIEFSSLREVRLDLIEDAAAVAEYRRHAEDAAQPSLFDTVEEADRKLQQFRALLQRRPKLVLNDLFAIRCEVLRKDNAKNFYADFDQVESTGTTIVLKVTLNLLVLRDLLVPGKARIPFYLDEVNALDRQNVANILQLSERLGFVGIFAAPTPAVGPRSFVHLAPDARGRLVVTAAHRKDIVRAPEDEAASPAPEEA